MRVLFLKDVPGVALGGDEKKWKMDMQEIILFHITLLF